MRNRMMAPLRNAALWGVLMVFGFYGGASEAAEFTMKLGTATVNDVQTYAMEQFAKRVEARSGGRIKTELYPSAQLGSNARMIEGLQLGTIEFYTGPTAYLVGVDPRYQVTDAPGVLRDARHAQQVFTDPEFRNAFLAIGESKGLIGLSVYPFGATSFATRFPGDSVAAFEGKKLRVLASELERRATAVLGATAVPIDFSEITASLQQGVIDGVKSGAKSFTSLKLYDIVDHIIATEEGVMGEIMVVSKAWWDKLPADLQAMLREEAASLEPKLWDYAIADQKKAYADWEAAGGKIHHLSEAERTDMIAKMRAASVELLMSNRRTKDMAELMLKVSAKY